MRIVLISFFSSRNIGDLLISSALYELVCHYGSAHRICYGAPERFSYTEMYDQWETSPGAVGEPQNNWFQSCARRVARMLLNWARLDGVLDRRRLYRSKNHKRIARLIEGSDLVVIGGGNMLFDVESRSRSASEFEYFVKLAHKSRRPVFAISLGIGPFATKRQEMASVRALHSCEFVTFRDRYSFEAYRSYSRDGKSFVTVDPVLLRRPVPLVREGREPHIALNLVDIRLSGGTTHEYLEIRDRFSRLVDLLLANTQYDVVLFSSDRGDYEAIREVVGSVDSSRCRVMTVASLPDLLDVYSCADLVIGCRMHALIVAYTQLLPVVGLSWQPKIDSFFEAIGQPGSVFPLRGNGSGELDPVLIRSLEKLNGSASDELEVRLKLEQLRDKFMVNEDILESFARGVGGS